MLKFWTKIEGYTILESLAAMLILSLCISLFLSMAVTIFTTQSRLDQCMAIIQFENNQISNEGAEDNDSSYSKELKSYETFDVLEIRTSNKNIEWSVWQVLENKK